MHPHHPEGYGATYYEAEQEVVRGPCDSYSSEYRVQEYANPGYSMGPHHHNNGGYIERVTEVASYESNPHHHHHGGIAGIVEKAADIIYQKTHDAHRKMC